MSNVTSTKFRFAIDRGGTFTDVYAQIPTTDGKSHTPLVMKLLSEDATYTDAPREAIRRILEQHTGIPHPPDLPVDTSRIEWIRMGTTVATNALLERKGEPTVFVTTKGFADLLHIGNQSRPRIFDLEIHRPELLYENVVEIGERVRMGTSDDPSIPTVTGTTGETLSILRAPSEKQVKDQLQAVYDAGIRSMAVALLHSYTYPEHELLVGRIALSIGFTHVSLSHALMPMVKIVPRGYTASADAYLTPKITQYLHTFTRGFDDQLLKRVQLSFMQSDGGLTPIQNFSGYRAVLSGPAGGVVGYATTTHVMDTKSSSTRQAIIGFDMGGTSTDVSRYDPTQGEGHYEHVLENTTAGVTILAPQLDINTVAAGGGSKLFFRAGMLAVGPDSAGALPGPACYRRGGPLTITDANLFLGRLVPSLFPSIFGPNCDQPLDVDITDKLFKDMTETINQYEKKEAQRKEREPKLMTPREVALGFVSVANEAMCRPIRALTNARGFDITQHVLTCFGGAGGQHACRIARVLGIKTVFIHRYSGILSAYGIAQADVVTEIQEPCAKLYSDETLRGVQERIKVMSATAVAELQKQGFSESAISTQVYLNLRYEGTDTAVMTHLASPNDDYIQTFTHHYKREYGFVLSRPVIIDDIRIRGTARNPPSHTTKIDRSPAGSHPKPTLTVHTWFDEGALPTHVYQLASLHAHDRIPGPAMIINETSTIVIEPQCEAIITDYGDVQISVASVQRDDEDGEGEVKEDKIMLSIFAHRFMSIAEQMGRTLQRTSISTNIKERLDFSCALFGPDGGLVANAPHLPVHLGAMQEAVRFQLQYRKDWKEGEVIVSNHPQAGGSHLPDITVITPVWQGGKKVFFVASRGHHSDIGGISPGSMPPFSKSLSEEGAAIMSHVLVHDSTFDEAGISAILSSESTPGAIGTRNLRDNLSDLRAQVAANTRGITLVQELIATYSLRIVQAYMSFIQAAAEQAVREMLREISIRHGLDVVGTLIAQDHMDDGSTIALSITIDRNQGSAVFDFTGTSERVYGNTNAPRAVTYSAIIYCLRCLVKQDIPLNQGCLAPIQVIIQEGCLLNPDAEAAVVGGNVLTSQRVTDVVLLAFRACAASQGCMNNLTFGDDTFGYYETIAGGAGAGPTWHGQSGVHTHMTNTRITDVEIMERRYPVLVRQFSLRPESGGHGQYDGGLGVIRSIEFLRPLSVGILSERRSYQPYGMAGGDPAQPGHNMIITKQGLRINLGAKNTYQAKTGDCIVIETPGGGGYGHPSLAPPDENGNADAAADTEMHAPDATTSTSTSSSHPSHLHHSHSHVKRKSSHPHHHHAHPSKRASSHHHPHHPRHHHRESGSVNEYRSQQESA